jgi:hypothetical protein
MIAYPNSGKHWIRNMLWCLYVKHRTSQQGNNHNQSQNMSIEDIESYAIKMKSKFSSHNLILLHRDPRDTAVSSYFHLIEWPHFQYNKPMPEYLRDPLNGIEKVIKFNLLYKDLLSDFNFIDVSYEEVSLNPVESLKKITTHFGYKFTDDALQKAVEDSSFATMRKREIAKRGQLKPEAFKTRRGVVGGYKDYLSKEDLDYCNDLLTQYNYMERMKA